MVCLDAAYGAQDQFLVIQDTHGEFMNIYGRVLYISLSVNIMSPFIHCHVCLMRSSRPEQTPVRRKPQRWRGTTRTRLVFPIIPHRQLVLVFAVSNSTLAERCSAQLFNQEFVTFETQRWNVSVSRCASQKFVLSSKVVALCLFSVGGRQSH